MILPEKATVLLGRNCEHQIYKIHFDTNQVTLLDGEKTFLTVSMNDVTFDFSKMNDADKREFFNKINN